MEVLLLTLKVSYKGFPGDIRDRGSIPGCGRSFGGRHSSQLQYSCLENPMDRGAWQAIVQELQRVEHDWSNLAHTPLMHIIWNFMNFFFFPKTSLLFDDIVKKMDFLSIPISIFSFCSSDRIRNQNICCCFYVLLSHFHVLFFNMNFAIYQSLSSSFFTLFSFTLNL